MIQDDARQKKKKLSDEFNIEIHYNRFGENYKYLIIYKPVILDDIHSLGVYFHYEEAVFDCVGLFDNRICQCAGGFQRH